MPRPGPHPAGGTMHEAGIMQSAMEIAVNQATRKGATRIHSIGMRVGDLSGVYPDALALAFETLREGTIAAGGRLDIARVPVVCRCGGCGLEFEPDGWVYDCP